MSVTGIPGRTGALSGSPVLQSQALACLLTKIKAERHTHVLYLPRLLLPHRILARFCMALFDRTQ